jgi:hypothetical protein
VPEAARIRRRVDHLGWNAKCIGRLPQLPEESGPVTQPFEARRHYGEFDF